MERSWATYRMNNIFNYRIFLLLLRYILGGVFIYASIDKIQNPQEFSDLIDNFHITPITLNNIFALTLPWLELIIGFGLITGFFLEASLKIIILLLIWFIFILAQAVFRGIDTHCGCFKVGDGVENIDYKFLLIKRIFEDVVFLGMALILKFKAQFNKGK